MRAASAAELRAEESRPLLLSIDLQTGRVTVAGELDRTVAHRLGDALGALALTGHRAWTVDAAGITFCDAEGLRVLAAATTLADDHGCTLRLVDAAPFTARLLRLVGMGHLLDHPADRSARGAGNAAAGRRPARNTGRPTVRTTASAPGRVR